MLSWILKNYFILLTILGFIALLCSVVFTQVSVRANKLLILYLTSNLITDFIAKNITNLAAMFNIQLSTNYAVYNTSVFWIFPIWFYYISLINLIEKSTAIKAIIFFILVAFANIFFIAKPNTFVSANFILGTVIFLLLSLRGVLNAIQTDDFDKIDKKTGVLLIAIITYFTCFSLLFAFFNAGLNKIKLPGNISLYRIITVYTNIIHYSLIIYYCFLNRNKKVLA
jgi:hypothetical protein